MNFESSIPDFGDNSQGEKEKQGLNEKDLNEMTSGIVMTILKGSLRFFSAVFGFLFGKIMGALSTASKPNSTRENYDQFHKASNLPDEHRQLRNTFPASFPHADQNAN